MKKKIAAPLEFHFLNSVLLGLKEGIKKDESRPWHFSLTAVTPREKKRLESFLDQKKTQSSQNKKEAEVYQEEIKKRLKLVTMIGGQIFKRISDRMNAATPK